MMTSSASWAERRATSVRGQSGDGEKMAWLIGSARVSFARAQMTDVKNDKKDGWGFNHSWIGINRVIPIPAEMTDQNILKVKIEEGKFLDLPGTLSVLAWNHWRTSDAKADAVCLATDFVPPRLIRGTFDITTNHFTHHTGDAYWEVEVSAERSRVRVVRLVVMQLRE